MAMLFPDDETWLSKFTNKYRTKKNVSQIGHHDLKKWAKLTDNTDGQYLAKYMAPDLWGAASKAFKPPMRLLDFHDKSVSRGQKLSRRA